MFVNQQGVNFELNNDNNTAVISISKDTKDDITISSSIVHESITYIITHISECSFEGSNIKTLIFTDSSMIRSIPKNSFANSQIQQLYLPPSIQRLDEFWCSQTPNLINITVSPDNKHFKMYNQQILVGKIFENSDNYDIIYFASRDIEIVNIPSNIKRINSCAFQNCRNIKSVHISKGSELTIIDKYAFSNSSIRSITIPKNTLTIDDYAFSQCKNIQSIDFESSSKLCSIREYAFSFSSISSIVFPSKVKVIQERLFAFCKNLKKIRFLDESELTTIESEAFSNSNIEEIYLPNKSIELKDKWCYFTPKLKIIKISSTNEYFTTIGNKILIGKTEPQNDNYDIIYFASRDIEIVKIPSNIKRINSCAFQNCRNIKSVHISKGSELTIIDKYAFSNSSIRSITIPKNTLTIDDYAFSQCDYLESVEFESESKLSSIGSNSFSYSSISNIQIPNNIKSIQSQAFFFCQNLNKVEFLDESKLTTIEIEAFSNSTINSIKIPKNTLTIGDYAFSQCNNIQTIEFDSNSKLCTISRSAFSYSSISSILIPSKVKIIQERTFTFCKNLSKVEFSDESELTTIESEAFSNSNIEEIYLPNKSIELKDKWCYFTPKLKIIKIPSTNEYFTTIGNKILIGKTEPQNDNYDIIYFASRDIEIVNIPSIIKQNDSSAISNHSKIITIDIEKTSKFKNLRFLQPLTDKYLFLANRIDNEVIRNMYSKFEFKYFKFEQNDELDYTQNIMFSLFFYLVNFKFIVYKFDNTIGQNKKLLNSKKINCIFCVENECLIIEQADISMIDILIKKLVKHQISLINVSSFSTTSTVQQEIIDEINSFCINFCKTIDSNFFVNYTIYSIVCYMIRRYFYPTNYFNIKSFFIFNQHKKSKEQDYKKSIKYFLFNELNKIETIINDINSEDCSKTLNQNDDNNLTRKFHRNEFIILRTIYTNDIGTYYLVIHLQSLYIFMMKLFHDYNTKTKYIMREIDFCKYSHRCFTPFYGFLMDGENIIGLIYEFMTNGTLNTYIENNKVDDMYLLMTIGRIFNGIKYLHTNKLIYRDLKPSNILIDHDNLPYISDFETVRSPNSTECPFSSNIGGMLYSSPEQDNGGNISYSTDVYSLGLLIYFLFEKQDMLQNFVKNEKIKQMTKGSHNLKSLYEKCVQYNPVKRPTDFEIEKQLNEEFNSFLYFENYLQDTKIQIIDTQIIDFIFEKILIQQDNEYLSLCEDQIQNFQDLILCKIDKNESVLLYYLGNIYYYGYLAKQDYQKAKDYYEQSSKFKNSKALNKLGIIYKKGLGVKQDYLKAKYFYEESSNLNDSSALNKLGTFYEEGLGVEQNYLIAKEYYKKASKFGNSDALSNLGDLYYYGNGVKQNFKKAKKYYEKSYHLNISACNNLGSIYLFGQGTEIDYQKARDCFETSSKSNDSFALLALGYIYENGFGVNQDYKKAKEYYEESADLNSSLAINQLGDLYRKGLGVKQDYLKAKKYYEESADYNNSIALFNLGYLYEKGLGVEQNYLKAKEYYERSAKLNNYSALLHLGHLYKKGHGVEKDYVRAEKYYEQSIKYNNSEAFFSLGNLYEKGKGVEQDYSKASDYYEISAKLNNLYAILYLGNFYSINCGSEINLSKAIKYYLKSISIQRGIIVTYDIINKAFISNFESNNYRYISYNNLGLIYLINLDDVKKGEEYLKQSAFAEYPIGQNNFGLFKQFYLKNIADAEYMYTKSSKCNFSIAEYNLGHLFEEQNKTKQSIEYYILASKHDNLRLTYYNITYKDKQLEISTIFINLLVNLKLVEHYFQLNDFDESKLYFYKIINKLKSIKKYLQSPLEIKIKFGNDMIDILSIMKKIISDSPLFSFINQTNAVQNNINVESHIVNKIKKESKSQIVNKSKVLKNNYSDENKISMNEFFEDLDDYSPFNKKQNTDTFFINEIKHIIDTMERILYKPPYSILFGRISIEKPKIKSVENSKDMIREIDNEFYEGFEI